MSNDVVSGEEADVTEILMDFHYVLGICHKITALLLVHPSHPKHPPMSEQGYSMD